MKKILIIVLALLMVIPFASCDKKSDKENDGDEKESSVVDNLWQNILDISNDEWLSVELCSGGEGLEWIEDELSEYGLDGKIEMYAWLETDGEGFAEAMVLVFGESEDAKSAESKLNSDDMNDEWFSSESYKVVRKDNTVVCGDKSLVEKLTK